MYVWYRQCHVAGAADMGSDAVRPCSNQSDPPPHRGSPCPGFLPCARMLGFQGTTRGRPLLYMIEKTRLDNGLRIITERMPHVRSASVGVWVESGSRHEQAHVNGVSHFIEHAVFKGTASRTARDIAAESDRLGGHLNA